MPFRIRASLPPLVALLVASLGCTPSPIDWAEETRVPVAAAAPPESTARARFAFTAAGDAPALRTPATTDSLGADRLPADSLGTPHGAIRACRGSVRVVPGRRRERWAAWWGVRADSSALPLVARSTDAGATWERAIVADTLDRGVTGCRRPLAAIAADSINGYVHLAYFLFAREGPGVFYAHLMDPRAEFEPATVMVYGERPSATDVASRGDTVVVTYEDPNSGRPQIRLAFSRTGGHLFEQRMVGVASGSTAAESPRVAAGPGGRIAVRWTERPDRPTGAPEPVITTVMRTGTLQ